MSQDTAPISREEQVLAEQMELELAAARHVQAKLLAADDPDEINGLGRTWQRVSRSLRQTVALKAKLTRERETAARPASTALSERSAADAPRRARIRRAAEAVREVLELERPDWDEDEDTEIDDAEIHEILVDLSKDDAFLDRPMDDVVAHAMRRLGFQPCEDDDEHDDASRPAPAVQSSA